jgi:hypothetical protein
MLNDKIIEEIKEYCQLNKIDDIDIFINKIVKQGFNVEKYGATPFTPEPKIIEKIVEKIIEVPVDRIVEKIIEVPVDKIIEREIETIIEKPVDNTERDKLLIKISELEIEIDKLNKEIISYKQKPQQKVDRDIYGDELGSWGSNLMDKK